MIEKKSFCSCPLVEISKSHIHESETNAYADMPLLRCVLVCYADFLSRSLIVWSKAMALWGRVLAFRMRVNSIVFLIDGDCYGFESKCENK